MNLSTSRGLSNFYELVSISDNLETSGTVIFQRRILIGKLDNCDLTISHPSISAIHAVVEILSTGGRVYDMNSKEGTQVNGNRIICQDIKVGDKVSFGDQGFIFKEYNRSKALPPPLGGDRVEEKVSHGKQKSPLPSRPVLPKEPPVGEGGRSGFRIDPTQIITEDSSEGTPYISYPLAKDPKADFSEYIFEDLDNIYPIFKWSIEKIAAEVIILHEDQIFSVDYLSSKKSPYHIKGLKKSNDNIEFPYLGKNQSIPFIEVNNGEVSVIDSLGYESTLISDEIGSPEDFKKKSVNIPIMLGPQDILKLQKNNLQIFVRNTQAPPEIKSAPLFRRNNESRKYFFLISILFILLLGLFSNVTINKEIEKEKIEDRLATILYRRKKFIAKKPKISRPQKIKKESKTPVRPKPKVATPRPKKVAKPAPKVATPRPKKVIKPAPKVATPRPKKVIKPAPKVATPRPKKVIKPAPKVATPRPKKVARRTRAPRKRPDRQRKSPVSSMSRQRSVRPSKSRGHVDAYRPSHKFTGTLSKLLAKGGKVSGVQRQQDNDATLGIGGPQLEGGSPSSVKRAKVAKNIGSLQAATVGRLDQSKGTEGLVNKKSIAFAGIPSSTIVLGSYDASVVAQILREHLDQFRSCYQNELNKSNKVFSGLIGLYFNIGASGSVSKAGVSKSDIPSPVERCVVNVLRGIKFPPPLGGGVVSIRTPMNFKHRRN